MPSDVRSGRIVHPDLEEAIAFHEAIIAEGSKALVGYETAKALANIVLLSEIPTTYDKKEQRQVNAGNLLLRGVPGVGKTFFGVILAAISDAKFARLQGRADLQPTEVVGFQRINPATGALVTEFGPLASAEEEAKLVHFDFKKVRLNPLMTKDRIIQLRSAISEHVFLHERLGAYIQRLVAATRPYNPDTDWLVRSPSELVEHSVDLGASPRAIICWGRLAKVWALLVRRRTEVYPEDIQDLAPHILRHRIWLGPHAASHGLTTDVVINDVIERVAIP